MTSEADRGPVKVFFRYAENGVVCVLLLAMAVIPVIEFAGRRWFGSGIPGANDWLQHLTLWLGFAGAVVAGREGQHLKIASVTDKLSGRLKSVLTLFAALVSVTVCAALFWGSLRLVITEAPALPERFRHFIPEGMRPFAEEIMMFESGWLYKIGGLVPVWLAQVVMPIGFADLSLRFIMRASDKPRARWLVALGIPLALVAALFLGPVVNHLVWPCIVLLVVAAFCGAPIFVLLGGAAVVLFWSDFVTVAAIPSETYRIVTSPVFPTIPIFTMVGFILSEGGASQRLANVFRTWFASIPGGTAVAVVLLCAFFTTFTGASGVTILALGGLLLPVLRQSGYGEKFSIGLLTSTGSIGLLLPPSLVVILYGVLAQVPITDMFKAALVPGLLLILPICLACIVYGRKKEVNHPAFDLKKALQALWIAKWEIAMPVLVLVLIFGGFCTLVEAAAIIAVYALAVESLVYRDLGFRDIVNLLVRCGILVGGVLLLLGVAMGFTGYLVDAQVPAAAAAWVEANIDARWQFLLALNLCLILVGCFMDIFSALAVVVPLILPMAEVFGINAIHLGTIFLANLQLGYLTPPIGMNLFLASFRFEKPMMTIARYTLPYLLLLAVVVLLITYVPALTLWWQ